MRQRDRSFHGPVVGVADQPVDRLEHRFAVPFLPALERWARQLGAKLGEVFLERLRCGALVGDRQDALAVDDQVRGDCRPPGQDLALADPRTLAGSLIVIDGRPFDAVQEYRLPRRSQGSATRTVHGVNSLVPI